MDFSEFKDLVLAAIADHNSKWTWYQLDRYLMRTYADHPEVMQMLMPALNELAQEERIRMIPNDAIPGMPRYEISSVGH